jgi:hypothetical protein
MLLGQAGRHMLVITALLTLLTILNIYNDIEFFRAIKQLATFFKTRVIKNSRII